MNLEIVFDATFLIALTFLGIVVPIFSLSVSLLGHAVEKSKIKSIERREGAEKELKEEFDKLEIQLKELRESSGKDIFTEAQKIEAELDKLRKSREKFRKESAGVIKRYDMLKFKESVLTPGFLFLCAIIFSLLSRIYILPNTAIISWLFSVLFLVFGIYRICKNLNVIQEVALSSDKYQQEKMFEAISKAFETRAEAEKTELKISFKNIEIPFKFPKSSEISINFKVELLKGKIARNTKVLFIIPKDFDFPNVKSKWNQDESYTIPNGLTTEIDIGDVRRGINSPRSIIIKTPSTTGNYKLGYSLSSEEFHKREFINLEII